LLFEQSVVHRVRVVGIGYEVLEKQALREQALVQVRDELGRVYAVAAIGQVGRHVADHPMGCIHREVTEIVQGAGFAELNGNAGLRVGRAIMRFVAH